MRTAANTTDTAKTRRWTVLVGLAGDEEMFIRVGSSLGLTVFAESRGRQQARLRSFPRPLGSRQDGPA